jgi:hypothetical protein
MLMVPSASRAVPRFSFKCSIGRRALFTTSCASADEAGSRAEQVWRQYVESA